MFCSRCGQDNAAGAAFCAHCGGPIGIASAQGAPPAAPPLQAATTYAPPTIPNYLVQAILVTLCCCLPFGIVSIVYAAQVNGKLQAGDVAGASQASGSAKTWAWVAFGVGLAVQLVYLVIMAIAGMSGYGR